MLLQDYIVDKKVLDVEGREVEVVYDLALALRQNRLFVVGVDVSRRALLRRVGLKWLANFTASITDKITDEIIAWNLVEPLPEKIGSFAGDIRLKVVKEELAKMPPVDVARILEQLTHDQRLAVFNGLVNGSASDALEELDPKSQREVIAAMPRDRAARLIDHMTPGQAADVLAVLPWSHANAIMRLLDKEKARKVLDILETQDERIVRLCQHGLRETPARNTALQARARVTNRRRTEMRLRISTWWTQRTICWASSARPILSWRWTKPPLGRHHEEGHRPRHRQHAQRCRGIICAVRFPCASPSLTNTIGFWASFLIAT